MNISRNCNTSMMIQIEKGIVHEEYNLSRYKEEDYIVLHQ